ncbi:MAG: class C beta-lactamase-related serine hydrolase [Promethearchaeota archaeon]|nr:MAG: class C beta-lactamase-related serine hydrolase [Candidatus Lokiarchaeota archaeon]
MKPKIDSLEQIIYNLMRRFKVPGVAISILQDGQIIYEKGFGARNLEENLPMTQNTLIGIGSITKSFTAMLILQFQEEGLLSIEDPVQKYLEMEPFLSHPDIQIKHLLSHSSGIPSVDAQWLPIAITYGDYERIYPVSSREDYLHHMSETKDEIFFKPREKFFYNNDMFALLGLIIEKITGNSFESVLTERILKPLEMTRSTVNRELLEKDPMQDYIRGYLHKSWGEEGKDQKEKKTKLEHPKLPFSEYLQAPGGIYTSMHELVNYGNCLLHKGMYNGNQLITADSIDILWTPIIECPYGYGKDPSYCFGWAREEDVFPYTLIHHGGGLGVSTSFTGLIPEINLMVNVAENDDMGVAGVIGMCALALMIGEDPSKTIGKYRLLEIYEQIKGDYKSSLGLYELEVFLKNQSIYIKVESDDGTFTFPLIAENLDTLTFQLFQTVPTPIKQVKFHRDSETGKIKFVTYDRYLYHKQ